MLNANPLGIPQICFAVPILQRYRFLQIKPVSSSTRSISRADLLWNAKLAVDEVRSTCARRCIDLEKRGSGLTESPGFASNRMRRPV